MAARRLRSRQSRVLKVLAAWTLYVTLLCVFGNTRQDLRSSKHALNSEEVNDDIEILSKDVVVELSDKNKSGLRSTLTRLNAMDTELNPPSKQTKSKSLLSLDSEEWIPPVRSLKGYSPMPREEYPHLHLRKGGGHHTRVARGIKKPEEHQNESSSAEEPDVLCSKPAIEQFPEPIMGQDTRASGGIILYIVATLYFFVAIAIICDDFFVPSLEVMCDRLEMSEDVAGATFMAAGSSAPELATSFIAVFVAEDDIGIGGVIGSAVFNILFVVSVCALAGTEICVNWWPVLRDCVFYCISICGLLLAIHNEAVHWYESFFLLFLYALYCVMMVYNKRVEEWANTLNIPFKNAKGEKNSLFGVKSPPVDASVAGPQNGTTQEPGADTEVPLRSPVQEVDAAQPQMMTASLKEDMTNPWEMPLGVLERMYWVITLPLVAAHYVTVPDCRVKRWQSWYILTFIMSMIWISVYSYVMVWMITVIGYTMGIPDTVMGLTLIAVGVSVPDALSSLCVVKQGYGDMAISNAIGSNVFDILICLGLPWFLKTGIVSPGSEVPVESKGLTYSTVSLFSTVVFLIGAMHYNSWRLDRKLGIMLLLWYLVFMIFASMYELNVFGFMNPPMCHSSF